MSHVQTCAGQRRLRRVPRVNDGPEPAGLTADSATTMVAARPSRDAASGLARYDADAASRAFQAVDHGIVVCNERFEVTASNPAAQRLLGRTHEQIVEEISDFHLVVEPPVVRWSLCLLLPADGRVVRLGPFEGSVAARGRVRTQAESRFQDAETADAVSRRHLRSDLVAAGVPSALAGAALRPVHATRGVSGAARAIGQAQL